MLVNGIFIVALIAGTPDLKAVQSTGLHPQPALPSLLIQTQARELSASNSKRMTFHAERLFKTIDLLAQDDPAVENTAWGTDKGDKEVKAMLRSVRLLLDSGERAGISREGIEAFLTSYAENEYSGAVPQSLQTETGAANISIILYLAENEPDGTTGEDSAQDYLGSIRQEGLTTGQD